MFNMNTTIWHRDGTFQYVQVFSSTVSIQYCNTRICNYTVSQNQKKTVPTYLLLLVCLIWTDFNSSVATVLMGPLHGT